MVIKGQKDREMNDNRILTYGYFRLGLSNPIRMVYSEKGRKIGAQTIDVETGKFVNDMMLMSRLELSSDAEEIPKEDFDKLVEDLLRAKDQ